MKTLKALGERLRRMADEEERSVDEPRTTTMRYPFGSKEAYEDWLKRSGRWFGE